MTIVLYKNNSVANKVLKNLTTVTSLTGTLRNGTSILSPSILVAGEGVRLDFNYFKIEEWNRYYFTGPPKFDINTTMVLNGVIDPLMSFSADILRARAIIRRQENNWNLYLNDERVVMNQNAKHKIVKFPNSFDDFSYILTLAGNGQN